MSKHTSRKEDRGIAFPDGFLWGAVASAHVTEGGNFGNDWWRWEQRRGRISDGSSAKVAAGHFERFSEDAALARKLGHNAHLMTLEWSRIQPGPDRFDDAALAHYAEVLRILSGSGITPVCAMQHVTLPAWFAEMGGWKARQAPDLFATYARRVVDAMGGECQWWIPLFEPVHAIRMGHVTGQWPPGSINPYGAAKAFRNIVLAHAFAAMYLREAFPEVRVGISVRARSVAPLDPHSVWDLRAARRQEHWHNHALIQAVQDGRLPFPMRQLGGIDNLFDFIGVGFYGVECLRFSPVRLLLALPASKGGNAAPEPSPAGFARVLGEMDRYGKPVLVTGNGLATEDDDARAWFLLDHLEVLSRRISMGSAVKGYFHYALLDGFEWSEGCSARHGLIHVDWATLARTPNQSAYLYKDICEHGALRTGTLARYCPQWRRTNEL